MDPDRYPAPASRRLPDDFQPKTFEDIRPWLEELEAREIHDAHALQEWLLDRSELDSAIAEESLKRMYANACHTDDAEIEKAHLAYQTEVLPAVKPVDDRLDRKYLDCPYRADLDREEWAVYDREVELGVRLFRQENVALEAEEEEIANNYARIIGAMTVEFDGEEMTLPALAAYGESPDRSVRESAWRVAFTRRLQDRSALDEVFDRLRANRMQQAGNADFPNYRDYMHTAKARFDYTPEDCMAFHANVERHVLPVVRRLHAHRQEQLGLSSLRPWDLAVALEQAPAFEPFGNEAEHVDVSAKLLDQVDRGFGEDLRWLHAQGLFDLETRPHKAPGGFMDTLERRRLPVIFSNSGTTHKDVETLLHEGGHAFHALCSRELEPVGYRMAPLEFAEVASMGMEALAMEHYAAAYPEEDARRARLAALEDIVLTFPWVATIDAFQHWLYLNPEHPVPQRSAAWLEVQGRFDAGIDWSGLEKEREAMWQRQLHIFQVPFYYIEYALAQMGAIQLWIHYRRDPEATVAAYRRALALGGSRPLPQLFEAAGLVFDPRGDGLGDWMAEIEQAWRAELKPQRC